MLIPVLIDEVSPPLGFGLIQAASLIDWDGDPGADAIEKLAADVAGVIRARPVRPRRCSRSGRRGHSSRRLSHKQSVRSEPRDLTALDPSTGRVC